MHYDRIEKLTKYKSVNEFRNVISILKQILSKNSTILIVVVST